MLRFIVALSSTSVDRRLAVSGGRVSLISTSIYSPWMKLKIATRLPPQRQTSGTQSAENIANVLRDGLVTSISIANLYRQIRRRVDCQVDPFLACDAGCVLNVEACVGP